MIPIKHILFLVSGVSSFIIFYMGLVNYLTAVESSTGMILLIFAVVVASGTLLSTVYISKSITTPIEKLAQNMTEFSKTNKIRVKKPINTNIKEIYELNENFESMGQKVEETIYVQKEYVEKLKDWTSVVVSGPSAEGVPGPIVTEIFVSVGKDCTVRKASQRPSGASLLSWLTRSS